MHKLIPLGPRFQAQPSQTSAPCSLQSACNSRLSPSFIPCSPRDSSVSQLYLALSPLCWLPTLFLRLLGFKQTADGASSGAACGPAAKGHFLQSLPRRRQWAHARFPPRLGFSCLAPGILPLAIFCCRRLRRFTVLPFCTPAWSKKTWEHYVLD